MLRRITAATVDFFIEVIPLISVLNIILVNVIVKDINPQIVPVVAFQLVLSPISVIQHTIEYPYSLGINIG